MGDYRRGFKATAERLALATREDLGLSWNDRLDPYALAEHIGVRVFKLNDLLDYGLSEESLRHLLDNGKGEFSAALFYRDGQRVVVVNPAHSTGRQTSNIVHEVSHLLLGHEPTNAVLEAGCRQWNDAMELEATWLAGELLVPREAALDIARKELDLRDSARRFGVSVKMMKWRLDHSGARKQAGRERAYWKNR